MVRPIALQDNLSKTPATEKITRIEKSQPELAQREAATEARRKAVEEQSKPLPADKADEVIIHREKEQEKNRKENKKDEKPDTEAEDGSPEKEDEKEKDEAVRHLDVRV